MSLAKTIKASATDRKAIETAALSVGTTIAIILPLLQALVEYLQTSEWAVQYPIIAIIAGMVAVALKTIVAHGGEIDFGAIFENIKRSGKLDDFEEYIIAWLNSKGLEVVEPVLTDEDGVVPTQPPLDEPPMADVREIAYVTASDKAVVGQPFRVTVYVRNNSEDAVMFIRSMVDGDTVANNYKTDGSMMYKANEGREIVLEWLPMGLKAGENFSYEIELISLTAAGSELANTAGPYRVEMTKAPTEPEPDKFVVWGMVTDEDAPVEGADVDMNRGQFKTKTDENGIYRFPALAIDPELGWRNYIVHAVKDGKTASFMDKTEVGGEIQVNLVIR